MIQFPERKEHVNITLKQRLSGPVLVTGGPQMGKTNVLATFSLQDATSGKCRWVFDNDGALYDKLLGYRASEDQSAQPARKTFLLDSTQSDYILMLPIDNTGINQSEAEWVRTLVSTINWAYTVHHKTIPLPASHQPKTWRDLIGSIAMRLPRELTQVQALFCPANEEQGNIFDDLLGSEALFMIKGSRQVQGSLCSMLIGDRLITELISRSTSIEPVHIYVDGFVHSVSPYFLETAIQQNAARLTVVLADSYSNIAQLKSLAPQIWTSLVQRTNEAGGFIVHGAGCDSENAKPIVRELARYMSQKL